MKESDMCEAISALFALISIFGMIFWIRSCVRDIDDRYYALLAKDVVVKVEICGLAASESNGTSRAVHATLKRVEPDAKHHERNMSDVDDGHAIFADKCLAPRLEAESLRKKTDGEPHDGSEKIFHD